MAFQREIDGNPRKRHHVRFWKCPEGWKLPGGFAVDWVGAGTYDKRVGLSLFTFQITHKIADGTDEERDFIIETLRRARAVESVHVIAHFFSGYHHRNGGGDAIRTDGHLPIIDLLPQETTTAGSGRGRHPRGGRFAAALEGPPHARCATSSRAQSPPPPPPPSPPLQSPPEPDPPPL